MFEEHKSVKEMWDRYLKHIGEDPGNTNKTYTSWHFRHNKEDADNLAALVKQGVKRGTTSLCYLYELENQRLPKAGDLCIITDWQGEAKCIIETAKVALQPFCEVTQEFAEIEGEGDKSLEYWRNVHAEAFKKTMAAYDTEFTEDMLVVCQEFEVVYI